MMKPGGFVPFADDTREVRYHLAEHEIMFSFVHDWHAAAFAEWWADTGLALFEKFAIEHEEEYR